MGIESTRGGRAGKDYVSHQLSEGCWRPGFMQGFGDQPHCTIVVTRERILGQEFNEWLTKEHPWVAEQRTSLSHDAGV
jgi:hypothetical protein